MLRPPSRPAVGALRCCPAGFSVFLSPSFEGCGAQVLGRPPHLDTALPGSGKMFRQHLHARSPRFASAEPLDPTGPRAKRCVECKSARNSVGFVLMRALMRLEFS